MRSTRFVLASTLLVLAASAGTAAAQAFKWTDKDGRVQYSDRPPPGAKTESVQSKVGSVSGPASAAPAGGEGKPAGAQPPMSYAEKDQAFRKRMLEQEEARTRQAKADDQAKQKTEFCQQARGRLAGLENGGRMIRYNEKGERVYLDDSAVEAEKARVRSDIAQNCKG